MIITSLLDTDLYKLTMMQCVFHRFPTTNVEYRFKLRKQKINFEPFVDKIKTEFANLCQLRFTSEELAYLKSLAYFKTDFINFLKDFKLNVRHIQISNGETFNLTIQGPWLNTILFEVPVLAIISEVYYQGRYPHHSYKQGRERLLHKMNLIKVDPKLNKLRFSDFGTRRRFSYIWQEEVVATLYAHLPEHFIGTSNVFFAKEFSITPIGTMAHEYVQAFQGLVEVDKSQRVAFEVWLEEYQGQLAIALSDTLVLKVFLKDFNYALASAYQGARHDSGDPLIWGKALLKHYRDFKIDPKTKTLVFSNALTLEKMITIYTAFYKQCKLHFGIGTYLTNDVGIKPLDIVIKMVECNGLPVGKITDDPHKSMGQNEAYIRYLKQVFKL